MVHDPPNIEDLLLDWHLDRVDDQDRAWVEEGLRSDAELRAKSERLGQILQPLDCWPIATGPANLADRVLARVRQPEHERLDAIPVPDEAKRSRRLPVASLRDLVAIAACILLLIGVFVPGVSQLRSRSRRAMCANNLGSLFRGVSAYRQDFASALPFAGYLKGASWLPGGTPNRPYASNSRHVYLLLKLNYGPSPADFLCPGCATGEPMPAHNRAAHADFLKTCNVGYDTVNLAASKPNLRPSMPVPYLSDANPLFVGARFNESVDPDRTNSPAHRGKGQTVLTLDGSARWMTTPVFGPKRDNLWLIGNIRRYTGTETPLSQDDVQLVPGFPSTDPIVRKTLREVQ